MGWGSCSTMALADRFPCVMVWNKTAVSTEPHRRHRLPYNSQDYKRYGEAIEQRVKNNARRIIARPHH
jgi:hypothetical protein